MRLQPRPRRAGAQLAAAADLTNGSFSEASFEELAGDPGIGPAQAEVIGLHGIYSWVSPSNRRHIVEIIRQRLVPGGLVYVSYDVPTGWAAMLPVQQALHLQVGTDRRRSDVAIRSAMATIEQFAEDGAAAFPLPPREQSMLDSMDERDPVYVAHEYLGGSFTPLMFADVAAELAAAKCAYVGSTYVATSLADLRVRPELAETLRSAPDVALRETICDLSSQTMFRADVFRRGLALVTPVDHRRHLDELQFVSAGLTFDPSRKVGTSAGAVHSTRPTTRRSSSVWWRVPRPSPICAPWRRCGDRSDHEVRREVAMLAAAGYALPALPEWERNGSIESAWRMNRALIESIRRGDHRGVLVSPATGNVVSVSAARRPRDRRALGRRPARRGRADRRRRAQAQVQHLAAGGRGQCR